MRVEEIEKIFREILNEPIKEKEKIKIANKLLGVNYHRSMTDGFRAHRHG